MRVFACATLIATGLAHAQDPVVVYHTPRSSYSFPEEADPTYVLMDGAPVRTRPDVDAPVLLKASAGEATLVLEATPDTHVQNGVETHWYRVALRGIEGWMGGADLAQLGFGSYADARVKFVAGIDHVAPSDTGRYDYSYRIVAVKDGRELDHIVVRSFAWGFEDVHNHGPRGLRNVDDVITLYVPCVGGCGCTTGEVVVFWSGGRFHHVADLMGSPDGDYSTNVTWLFPSDMAGEGGVIIRKTSDYREVPNDADDLGEGARDEEAIERFVRTERLRWTGAELVPDGSPQEQRFRIRVGQQ